MTEAADDRIVVKWWDVDLPQVWASVTFWDRERSHADLAELVARLSEDWPVDHAVQQVRLTEPAGVAVLDIAFVDEDGDRDREASEWTQLARLITSLVAEVDPEVALVGIIYGGGDLPTDPWDASCEAWHDGYVRSRSLSADQRDRFETLVRRGTAHRCHRGIAWASGGLLDPTTAGIPARPTNIDPYVAWSGSTAPLGPVGRPATSPADDPTHTMRDGVVVRRMRYCQEQVDLTLHDPELDEDALAAKVLAAADALGVECEVTRWRPDDDRSNIGVALPFEDFVGDHDASRADFRRVARRAAALVEAVRPATALVTVHGLPVHYPDDDWDECDAWAAGYVRRDTLTGVQASSFEQLVADGLAYELGGGIAWPVGGILDPQERSPADGDAGRLAYSAWTGRTAPEPLPVPKVPPINLLDLNLPVLWVYDPRRDTAELERLVRRSVPASFEVHVDDEVPDWPRVDVHPPGELTDQEVLLGNVRDIALSVRPAFVALLPQRGFFLPGVHLEVPASGKVDHVWVDDAWVGDRRDELRTALHPVVPERVGDGDLYVTYTDLRAPGGATTAYGSGDALDGHLTAAATILGEVAVQHRSRGDAGTTPDS